MRNFLESLAGASDFMPHGYCLVWDPGLVWLHVGSDVLTGLAYYLVAAGLGYLVSKRRDLPFFWIFLLFGAFIFACGTTHFMAAWTIYVPSYWLEGVIKTGTAAISVVTALLLVPLLPRLLNLPNLSRALEENRHLNQRLSAQVNTLQEEVLKRQAAEEQLTRNHALQFSLIDSIPDLIFYKDINSVYQGCNKAFALFAGRSKVEIIGQTDLDFFPKELAELFREKDRQMFRAGSSCRNEEWVEFPEGRRLLFDTLKTPFLGPDNTLLGLIGISRDITESKRAATRMQDQVRLLDLIFAYSLDCIVLLDKDYNFVRVSETYAKLCHRTVSEFQGRNHFELYPSPLKDEFDDAIRRGITYSKSARPFTFPDHPELGVTYWNLGMVPIRGADDRVELILLTLKDVTESKRADEQLRLDHEIITNINDGVYLVRASDGVILYANRQFEKMFGYDQGEVIGRHVSQVNSPIVKNPQDTARGIMAELDEQGIWRGEVLNVKKDGTTFWCDASVTCLTSELLDYGPVWVAVHRDITERKKAEEALAQAEREWSAAMDASDDVIYLLDLKRQIVRANKTFYLATGTTPATAIGRHIVEVVHPLGEAIPCPVCLAQEEKRDLQVIMEAGHPDNPVGRPLEITVKIIRDQEARPLSILMTLHDLTTARQEMAEKETLAIQLQQAQKMESVGRLAGGVAHDFNNMLGVIIGHTELAMDLVDPAQPLYASLTEIHKAARRSADLTRQLLAFARKQTIAPKVLDLNETVAGMLKMLQRLIGENILLNWRPDPQLWPVKIDPSQIDQILANLCVNARDVIADVGTITIETGNSTFAQDYRTAHADFVPGDYVRLVVSDTGRGMDKETLAHIFEPFFTTKGVGKGTGLGLATVYGVVRQNAGFINVCSEPAQGTRFTIYLPRYTGQAAQERREGAVGPAMRGQETILLVEDEPAILEITTRMLAGQGYIVRAASTPGEAIRLAQEHAGEIHLLMTDVVMPEMNGRDLAKNLLSLYPNLKRLFMSGYTADVIAHRGVLDEGVHFIQKPFSIKDLATKVREVLEHGD